MKSCLKASLFISLVHLTYSMWVMDSDDVGVSVNSLLFPDARSPMYLVQLAKHEADLFQALTEIESSSAYQIPPVILDTIRRYQKMYTDETEIVHKLSGNHSHDANLIIGENPILAFNMIWRFVHELTLVHHLLQPYYFTEEDTPGVLLFDSTIIESWPTKSTLEEAMTAILRIQLTYDLDPTELESGKILGIETGAQMSLPQIIKLSKFATTQKRYTLAIPWLELAMDKLFKNPELEIVHNVTLKDLELSYAETAEQHNLELAQNPAKEYEFYKEPLSSDVKQTRISTRKLNHAAFRKSNSNYGNYDEYYYWSLCSGNIHQTKEEKSALTCWYDTTSSKSLAIYPIKTEMLSKKPYLVQMYDVLSDSKINEFLDPAHLTVMRSGVVSEEAAQYNNQSEIRTSVDLIQSNQHPQQLNKYISSITGLDLENPVASEPFHLVSYAFGGHFDCHLDAFPEEYVKSPAGNRMATIMFYLDDVEKGGLTAFPRAGVAATPIKGSALLWYNLKRNGIRDRDTLHCACPVIQGRKTLEYDENFLVDRATVWPLTIEVEEAMSRLLRMQMVYDLYQKDWMHQYDQLFLHYPCDLHPGQKQILFNIPK